ncbi:hypothetical protein CVT26_003552 [Gymnopilus dilepis]|uniref:RING-type domain-containing protein n=1 Tax=Gymnopilus dilepis TaxID=231916 RepID=A0A409VS71_9AGAR|nr:hypothetical protein CVT26_003552 [Gymnopilus dilepis]
MPVSTRQPTPGPSSAVLLSANVKKRSGSEAQDDARTAKKIKVEDDAAKSHITSVNGKDKKKKNRRKKKRRSSVVVPVIQSHRREDSRSKSRSVPPSTNAINTVLHGFVPTGAPDNDEDMESVLSASDKGKGRASPAQRSTTLPSDSPPPIDMGAGSSVITPLQVDSAAQEAEITRLKEQLATQKKLLERHQTHFTNHQQTLTCQICLDLMHRPYALAPCGHTTCYPCLVRWFTAPQNPEMGGNAAPDDTQSIDALLNSAQARNGTFMRRRKKCPVCRAVVIDRPVEMWAIKSMVAALVRSGLGDLPVPVEAPAPEEGANTDPWRNVFRKSGAGHRFGGVFEALFGQPAEPPQQAEGDREQMGWYDAEDGGIYRCITCYHEIWDGVCSACRRRYPGHGGGEDDGDDDEDDDEDGEVPIWGPVPIGGQFWPGPGMFDDSEDDLEEDDMGDDDDGDEDDDGLPHLHLHPRYLPALPFAGLPQYAQAMQGHIEEVDDDDEEDEEENSEYEGSFIDDENGEFGYDDDDGEEVEVLDRLLLSMPRNNRRRQALFDDDGDQDHEDEDEDEDPPILARRLGRATRMGSGVRNNLFAETDSESEGSIEVVEDGQEDEEGDEDEDEGHNSSPPPRRHHQRRMFLEDD